MTLDELADFINHCVDFAHANGINPDEVRVMLSCHASGPSQLVGMSSNIIDRYEVVLRHA